MGVRGHHRRRTRFDGSAGEETVSLDRGVGTGDPQPGAVSRCPDRAAIERELRYLEGHAYLPTKRRRCQIELLRWVLGWDEMGPTERYLVAVAGRVRRKEQSQAAANAPHPFMPSRDGTWCLVCQRLATHHPVLKESKGGESDG
jgi:hypothetical protein